MSPGARSYRYWFTATRVNHVPLRLRSSTWQPGWVFSLQNLLRPLKRSSGHSIPTISPSMVYAGTCANTGGSIVLMRSGTGEHPKLISDEAKQVKIREVKHG